MYRAENFTKLLTEEEKNEIKKILTIILHTEINEIEPVLNNLNIYTMGAIFKQCNIPSEKIKPNAFLFERDYIKIMELMAI